MPTLVFDKDFLDDFARLDPPVRQKVRELPGKFEEAAHTGVHLEKINGARDDRVRTVRVDQFWRGVVVSLGAARYALLRVLPHDDAAMWAMRQRFGVNPATGIVEVIDVGAISEQVEVLDSPTAVLSGPPVFGDVSDSDFRRLGIDEEIIPVLRLLKDEAQTIKIATLLPKAQGDAVLLLADGMTPDEVWGELAADYLITDAKVDPDDVDAALERAGSKAEFIVTTNDSELLALLSGDFEAWRTFLHPAQQYLAERPAFNGPVKVTGGAGTGKTVVAIHRARFLARQLIAAGDTTSRVLFATYTTSLARNLERVLMSFCEPQEFKRIQVSTVDSLASQTLTAAGVRVRPALDQKLRDAADLAATMEGIDDIGLDGRFLLAEWEQVIVARQISSLEQYVTSPRPGRGRSLNRSARRVVWSAVNRLVGILQTDGFASFAQIADLAAGEFGSRIERPYAHVIVDEAQDLHPSQWRLVRAAVAPGVNDLFIVGDAHQRIYDNRVSLASLGIETRGRSRRLKINYRTSQQILGWALGILTGEEIDDLDGNAERQVGYRSEFQGPVPIVRVFDSMSEESNFVLGQVRSWLDEGVAEGSIGVLARTNEALTGVEAAFDGAGIGWANLGGAGSKHGLHVGTMHSSKGLEFERLILVGVSRDRVPSAFAVTDATVDPEKHAADLVRERCLLYVACTRARDALVVTSSGPLSEFVPGLSG